MAQSLYKALRRVPGTTIDVLTPPAFEPLLAMMPEVDECIRAPFRRGRLGLAERYRLGRGLAGRAYDQAIVLPNSWKSALPPWLARIPVRTGYLGEQRWGLINDVRKLDKQALPTTAQRFTALAAGVNEPQPDLDTLWPGLETDRREQHATAEDLGLGVETRPVLVLCPGAHYGPSKQWPAVKFAQIAATKLGHDWQIWLLGSGSDAAAALEINRRCENRCIDLTGRTSVAQAVHLMALSTAVVSNDSGLMHIAAALAKPLVAIFGSTDPRHTPPLSKNHRIEYLGLSCSPCFKRRCPLRHVNCLNGITPQSVLDDLEELCAS